MHTLVQNVHKVWTHYYLNIDNGNLGVKWPVASCVILQQYDGGSMYYPVSRLYRHTVISLSNIKNLFMVECYTYNIRLILT